MINKIINKLKNIPNKIKQIKLINQLDFIKLEKVIKLGTEYGGWFFIDDKDLYGTTIISAGLGEDASFDIELINKYNISKDRFEFQVLFGVPMGNRLELLKDKGYKIRIYVPFGEAWFDYSIRRLKENPKIISYILTNIFKK